MTGLLARRENAKVIDARRELLNCCHGPEERLPRSSRGEPRLLTAAEAMQLHLEHTHVFVDVREEGEVTLRACFYH